MKKLLLMLMLVLSTSMSSQVYALTYTHYCQIDTVSKQMMPDVAYNTVVFIDYYKNQVSIEDNYTKFVLDITYNQGNADDLFFQCISSDGLEWKVSTLALKNEYLCVVTHGTFTRIYKKQR